MKEEISFIYFIARVPGGGGVLLQGTYSWEHLKMWHIYILKLYNEMKLEISSNSMQDPQGFPMKSWPHPAMVGPLIACGWCLFTGYCNLMN